MLMRRGGSKQKGSAFERLVCKTLSLWVSDGKHKDVFWRSAMSGGRSTVAMRKGDQLSAQAGDVSSVHKLGHAFIDRFVVECKAYRSLNFEGFIKGKGTLIDFWKVLKVEAKRHEKLPLLIGKQNNYPVIVCLSRKGMLAFGLTAKVKVLEHDLAIVLLDDLLKVNPRFLRRVRL